MKILQAFGERVCRETKKEEKNEKKKKRLTVQYYNG